MNGPGPSWGNPNDIELAVQYLEGHVLDREYGPKDRKSEALERVMWAAEQWVEMSRE